MMCPIGHEGHATKTGKLTNEQIAFALNQAEPGKKVEEICRKLGTNEAALYNERVKFGGSGRFDLHRRTSLAMTCALFGMSRSLYRYQSIARD
ncbi:transposase [Burkholderia lata]|uniref:transposase n=1 Tax=Burkholderia lata (strain ATCC 17760 / DSM 23089 / LMG 22485 / NCIMB 9086 / R18194 / 383) TaxID=482957 RepID=UPI00399B06BC